MAMSQLAYEAMKVDIEMREKLKELLDLLDSLTEMKKKEDNPVRQQRLEQRISRVNELIGKIRFHSLDKMGTMSKGEEE